MLGDGARWKMNPVHRENPESQLKKLVPGGDPSDKCTVDAAKRNLDHPCVRYIFTDRLADGFKKLSQTLPDFAYVPP